MAEIRRQFGERMGDSFLSSGYFKFEIILLEISFRYFKVN